MKKQWGGRFTQGLDAGAREFSYSLPVDKELLPYDIQADIAHVKTLARAKVLRAREATRLIKGLTLVERTLEKQDLGRFSKQAEDIHTLIQNVLERKVGTVAKKLHTGRSRNDQVATATQLYLKDKVTCLISALAEYQKSLLFLARKAGEVVIPGYTHLQRAQAVLLAHHLVAYVEMAERDKERLHSALTRIDALPLGAGALAGVSFPLDRAYTARVLGFSKVSTNSMDAVSSRDCLIEVLAHIAIISMHLSRLSEDFILWNSEEFGFIEIPDAFTTGSSIMPHKKNPDICELVRGRSGTAYGNLMALLVTMKGLPLSYNRDMQEDKRPLFSSVALATEALSVLARMIRTIRVNQNRCLMATADSFLYATDLMDYIVKKGVPLEDAHTIVGRIVRAALEKQKDLATWSVRELQLFCPLFDVAPRLLCSPERSVRMRKTSGSTNPYLVKRSLNVWQKRLDKNK